MIQLSPLRHGPNLVRNGTFRSGLAHWFGSYLRHERVQNVTSPVDFPLPLYQVRFGRAKESDYTESIPSGLSQFIDNPTLYTFPASRTVTELVYTYIGDQRSILRAQLNSRINTLPLVLGDPSAEGQERFFQHPFLFLDGSVEVAPEIGSSLIISSDDNNVSGEYKVGSLIKDTTGQPEDFRDHQLIIGGVSEPPALIESKRHFPEVTAEINPPNIAGFSGTRFVGPGYDQIVSFPRPDGTQGIRVNDVFLYAGGAARVDSVATGNNLDPAQGGPSFNIVLQRIRNVEGLERGESVIDWSIYPQVTVQAEYEMPLFLYEFTLIYSFLGSVEPADANISYRGLTNGTSINGLGDIVAEINSSPAATVVARFSDDSILRRKFEYFRREVPDKIQGRALLNIPSGGSTLTSASRRLTSARYIDEPSPLPDRIEFSLIENALAGSRLISAEYNVATQRIIITTESPVAISEDPFESFVYISGYYGDNVFQNRWLTDLQQSFRRLYVESVDATNNRLTCLIPSLTELPNQGSLITGLQTTPLRAAAESNPEDVRFRNGQTILIQGTFSPQNVWLRDYLDIPTEISKLTVTEMTTDQAVITFLIPARTGTPVDSAADLTSDNIFISREVGLLIQETLSDINLFKGFAFPRANITDDGDILDTNIGDDVSLDPLLRLASIEDIIIPTGTTILYAGGGVCPNGFKPVRNLPNSNEDQLGLRTIHRIPTPDAVEYDSASDTTVLRYLTESFNRVGPDGEPEVLESATRYELTEIPGTADPEGNPVFQQLAVTRAKQLVEPGMTIRVPDFEYTAQDSVVVDNGTFSPEDYRSPLAGEDRGFLVVDVVPAGVGDGAPVPSAGAYRDPVVGGGPSFSLSGAGFGPILYPAANPGEFDRFDNSYPDLPPAGPTRSQQNSIFPDPDRPFAFLSVSSRISSNRAGQTRDLLSCVKYTSLSQVDQEFEFNGFRPRPSDDYLQAQEGSPENRFRPGDVFFAEWYVWPTVAGSFLLGGGIQSGMSYALHEAFLCRIERRIGDSTFHIGRYDNQQIKLMGLDAGSTAQYGQDRVDGSSSSGANVRLSMLVLRPAKLYGPPGSSQILIDNPNSLLTIPAPEGAGFSQQRINTDNGIEWVSTFLSQSLALTVTGRLDIPTTTKSLFVEPSGYLRYDDKIGMDYGTSGHTHTVTPTSLLQKVLPRVHPDQFDEYPPLQLPTNHGHTAAPQVVYPLPKAALFTLCTKI